MAGVCYLFVSSIVDGLVRSSTSCCSNELFFALPGVFMGCAMAIGLVIPAESSAGHRPLSVPPFPHDPLQFSPRSPPRLRLSILCLFSDCAHFTKTVWRLHLHRASLVASKLPCGSLCSRPSCLTPTQHRIFPSADAPKR